MKWLFILDGSDMSIGPKPKHNPCIEMQMLVDGALKELDNQTEFRTVYFNGVFRMLEIMKYMPGLRYAEEYDSIADAFEVARPQNIDRDEFIIETQQQCRILGIPNPFVVDDEKIEILKTFLKTLSEQLSVKSKTCKVFENGLVKYLRMNDAEFV